MRRRPTPSREIRNSAYWPCLRHIRQDRVLPVELNHTSLYDLQYDTAFRFGLNGILICNAQPRVDLRCVRAHVRHGDVA